MRLVERLLATVLGCSLAASVVLPANVAPAFGQTGKPAASAASAGNPLDINTATVDQLKALPGIGDAYAARIIKGRPYTAKNQLTQRGILPDATYSRIQPLIIARRPSK